MISAHEMSTYAFEGSFIHINEIKRLGSRRNLGLRWSLHGTVFKDTHRGIRKELHLRHQGDKDGKWNEGGSCLEGRVSLGRAVWVKWFRAEWTEPGSWMVFRCHKVSSRKLQGEKQRKDPEGCLWPASKGDRPGAGKGWQHPPWGHVHGPQQDVCSELQSWFRNSSSDTTDA